MGTQRQQQPRSNKFEQGKIVQIIIGFRTADPANKRQTMLGAGTLFILDKHSNQHWTAKNEEGMRLPWRVTHITDQELEENCTVVGTT